MFCLRLQQVLKRANTFAPTGGMALQEFQNLEYYLTENLVRDVSQNGALKSSVQKTNAVCLWAMDDELVHLQVRAKSFAKFKLSTC